MSRKLDRLLARMQSSPSGFRPIEVKSVLVGHGFKLREGSKHTVYQHCVYTDLIITVPRHSTLRAWVARDVLKLVRTLSQREKEVISP